MASRPQLPIWTSYAQALAAPITGVAVLLGAWIAARQLWIADEKLWFDIYSNQYEKRFAVYKATLEFLHNVFHSQITEDDLRSYGSQTLQAKIIFDADMYEYLRDICSV